jgi:hypothetical protein
VCKIRRITSIRSRGNSQKLNIIKRQKEMMEES